MATPPVPSIWFPRQGEQIKSTTVYIEWTNVLLNDSAHSFYEWQMCESGDDFDPLYDSGTNPHNNPQVSITSVSQEDYEVRVRSARVVGSSIERSAWSPVRSFTVDYGVPTDEETDREVQETKLKRVPKIYGRFNRHPLYVHLSDGLAKGYLTNYYGADPLFTFADHVTAGSVAGGLADLYGGGAYQLFVPLPGTNTLIQVQSGGTLQDCLLANDGKQIVWVSSVGDGKYRASQAFALSSSALTQPFNSDSNDPADQLWRAIDYENVTDNDPSVTSSIKVHSTNLYYTGITLNWRFHAQSAWNIYDPAQILPKILEGDNDSEMWVRYANLTNQTEVPTTYLETNFQLCNASINVVGGYAPQRTIFAPGTAGHISYNNPNYRMSGPVMRSDLAGETSREYSIILYTAGDDIPATSYTPPSPTEAAIGIGAADILVRRKYTGADRASLFEVWAGMYGRPYGTWISDFVSGSLGQDSLALSRYNYNNAIPIEDPSMIIASLMIDEAGWTTSDFDIESFVDGNVHYPRMRINITEEGATIGDVIEQIQEQCPLNFTVTATGKAKLINYRTPALISRPVDATISYQDIDADSFTVKETPLSDVVNDLTIKSRYHAETGTFLDQDHFENSASIARYGRKKRTLEFKNVNTGPHERDSDGNVTQALISNPVKWAAVDLVEPDLVNSISDDVHRYDDGFWAKRHPDVSVFLPGYQFMKLQIGDRIMFDNDSFVNHNIKCFNDAWGNKQFTIQRISKSSEGVRIDSAVHLNDYDNYYDLRGFGFIHQP